MRKLVLLVALGCAVTACSPSEPAPTAAPTPTLAGTPSVDPSTDPLYLEAVDVYKKFFAEVDKAEMSGFKPASLSPAIDPYVTGTMKEVFEEAYKADRASGLYLRGTEGKASPQFAPNPGVSKGGSVISIRLCTDASGLEVVEKGTNKVVGHGTFTYDEVYFKREGETLKGFAQDSKDVSKCPIS